MEEIISVKDVYGNDFLVRGDKEGKFISVLAPGYIILKDGTFILTSDNHGESLTDFYVSYHKIPKAKYLTTQEAIKVLASDGFVVYLGTNRNSVRDGDNFGFSVLYLNDDLTEEQKESCKKLLNTNKRLFHPDQTRVTIEYGNGVDLTEFSHEQVEELLITKEDKIK